MILIRSRLCRTQVLNKDCQGEFKGSHFPTDVSKLFFRDLATKFAAQTLFGASKTILDTGIHPGQAKDQVTSAGGTTIYGLHELEKGRIRDTLINCVEAATKRSQDLAPK